MKFKFKAEVMIIDAIANPFYEGCRGIVVDYTTNYSGGGISYKVKITSEVFVWVPEGQLKTVGDLL